MLLNTHFIPHTQPGRVATLVDDPKGSVHGLGFEISQEEADATFNYLNDRETGYNLREVIFHPGDPTQPKQKVGTSHDVSCCSCCRNVEWF